MRTQECRRGRPHEFTGRRWSSISHKENSEETSPACTLILDFFLNCGQPKEEGVCSTTRKTESHSKTLSCIASFDCHRPYDGGEARITPPALAASIAARHRELNCARCQQRPGSASFSFTPVHIPTHKHGQKGAGHRRAATRTIQVEEQHMQEPRGWRTWGMERNLPSIEGICSRKAIWSQCCGVQQSLVSGCWPW